MPAFWNQITIPSGTTIQTNYAAGGWVNCTITAGTYFWDTLVVEIITQLIASTGYAGMRAGLSSTGHISIDSIGSAYQVDWTTTTNGTYFRDLLGFTENLASATSHLAPRRVRAALYLENGSGVTNATIREHDPKPMVPLATQTLSLGGVSRTTIAGAVVDETTFEIQFLDNSARHTSPSGAVATTYANAASTVTGLTQYTHARDLWWDSSAMNTQGWNDGRPVRYFPTSSDASDAVGGGTWTLSSTTYTTWVFGAEVCKAWPSVKARPPKTTAYHLTLPAREYVAP